MAKSKIIEDLFGMPVVQSSGRRGRPAHRWSLEVENKVKLALVMGFSTAEVAAGVGVSVPTLRKYYFSALKEREMQRTRYEVNRATSLHRLAADGNVGASKELQKMIDRRDRAAAALRLKEGEAKPEQGKKIQRQVAAEEAAGRGGLFGPGYKH